MTDDSLIPTIDLGLLKTDGGRDKLLDELKHALIDYGFFHIINYDEHLDQNLITSLSQEIEAFFALTEEEKGEISIENSKHFVGYVNDVENAEKLNFISTDGALNLIENDYDNIYGPNQYPSKTKLPFFKKSVKDFIFGLDEFSILISKLVLDSIHIKTYEASSYIDFKNPHDQFSELKALNILPKETSTNRKQSKFGIPFKYSNFLTFSFQSSPKYQSLQIQDLYGKWINATPKPGVIACTVGQTLEYLTNGLCISGINRIISHSDHSVVSLPYLQHIKLKSKLKPFRIKADLLKERDDRNSIGDQSVELKFKPFLGVPFAKTLFYSKADTYRSISSKYYPEILKELDQESFVKKEEMGSNSLEIPPMPKELERMKKIFTAFDNVLILHTINHTADIKLHNLIRPVKNLTRFNLELQDFLQIAYIWPDFVGLKIDDQDDYIIDIDETKDKVNFQEIDKRSKIFSGKLEDWYERNYANWKEIPAIEKSKLRTKSLSSMILKRARTEVLQKQSKKQKPNEKPSSSLSLLQRIKMKEKARLDNQISMEMKYDIYLFDKLGQVLEIFSSLRSDLPHSLMGLTERVVNSLSLTNALAQTEAKDLILRLSKEFPQDFRLFEGKSASVLRWKDFDVVEFKERLKSKLKTDNSQK